jgi:hypothetical protein
MTDFNQGDMVFATWLDDGFLYPCVIISLDDDVAHVAYLDGDEGDVAATDLVHGEITAGMNVSVNYKGRGLYYGGVVVACVGMAVEIQYDDGECGWVSLAQCRVSSIQVSRRFLRPSVN